MGIDYGKISGVNRNSNTGIHYGVIPQHRVGEAWYEDCEGIYGPPHCPNCGDELDGDVCDGHECECGYTIEWVGEECYGDAPCAYGYGSHGYKAQAGSDGDIFVTDSPYYTLCAFCSPCAPGAGHLTSEGDDCKAYCFGHEWFEDCAPYDVYDAETDELVVPVK